jgi:hypothetical protein
MHPESEYYAHVNGDLIYKPHGGVDATSDFVVKVWSVPLISKSPKNYLAFLVDAFNHGVSRERILELARHQNLDDYVAGATAGLEKLERGELTPDFDY